MNAEFVGYLFEGPPPKTHRLWFIERQLKSLLPEPAEERYPGADLTVDIEFEWGGHWSAITPDGAESRVGLTVRYEDGDGRLAWRLTDSVIHRVNVLGRDDDVWRLGLWPD